MVCQSAEEIKILLTVAQKYKDDKAQSRADRNAQKLSNLRQNRELWTQSSETERNGNVLHTLQ